MARILPFNRAAEPLDPERVEALCAQDRWLNAPDSPLGAPRPGRVPDRFRDIANAIPATIAARQLFMDAADRAEAIYRGQIEAELDPADVVRLCEAEPWSDKNISQFRTAIFGRVPERFLEAARRYESEPDKAEHYHSAYKTACAVYHEQMKKAARVYATGKSRAEVEEMSAQLWRRFKPQYQEGIAENIMIDPGLEGTDIGARLLWMAHVIGHIQRGLVPAPGANDDHEEEHIARIPLCRAVPVPVAVTAVQPDQSLAHSPFLQRRFAAAQARAAGGKPRPVPGFEDHESAGPLFHAGRGRPTLVRKP